MSDALRLREMSPVDARSFAVFAAQDDTAYQCRTAAGSDLHHFGLFALEVVVDRFDEFVGELLNLGFDVAQPIFG